MSRTDYAYMLPLLFSSGREVIIFLKTDHQFEQIITQYIPQKTNSLIYETVFRMLLAN